MKTYLTTFTGKRIDPFKLLPEQICLGDIAHSLAYQPRWAGHLPHHLSIAEHSILVAWRVYCETKNVGCAFIALMHDASEAYCQDLISPIKARMPSYRKMENKIHKTIAKHYGYNPSKTLQKIIKKHDLAIRDKERFSDSCWAMPANIAERNFKRLFNFLRHAYVHGASQPLVMSAFMANM